MGKASKNVFSEQSSARYNQDLMAKVLPSGCVGPLSSGSADGDGQAFGRGRAWTHGIRSQTFRLKSRTIVKQSFKAGRKLD
jgi:hypothetical protein